MIPLGFYNVCLKTDNIERTVAFYRRLGFVPTGEDAPGLRISLKNGTDELTFMSFLTANLINFFGGAHLSFDESSTRCWRTYRRGTTNVPTSNH